jgi:predicted TIM-barrel fold metal-dependent hydrolase
MRYVDAFNHFFPKKYFEKMLEVAGDQKDIGKRVRGVPCLYDLDVRFAVMDQFKQHDYVQVLSLPSPPIELMADGAAALEMSRIGTDGMAELVARHPDRFVGYVSTLPMNDPQAAAREAERAFTQAGANGLQLYTNVRGKPLDLPEFLPVFEMAARHDKPILLHPIRGAEMPDYCSEDRSRYEIWWTFGWPYETSAAMARLVFSGLFDRLPGLKIVTHHLGAMVPYFEGRVGPGWNQLGARTSDEDLGAVLRRLKRRPLDYFKSFYADTAVFGSRAATVCGLDFFGPDRVLFASDSPFDPEKGPGYIRDTIAVLESLDLDAAARAKINYENAEQLFGLPSG